MSKISYLKYNNEHHEWEEATIDDYHADYEKALENLYHGILDERNYRISQLIIELETED